MKKMIRASILALIALSYATTPANTMTTLTKKSKDVWVTIFVHGSFSLKPHLTLGNALNVIFDRIEDSVYYRSTEINRRDPFFYKNQVMLGLGLHKIDMHHPNKEQAARIIAASYERISQYAGNEPSEEYYAFGWSGLVSHKLRYLEAGILYQQLSDVSKKLKSEGKNPKIRIISYSHGGNLSIQLGAVHVTKAPCDQISIDELYLNGTPVQIETDYLVNSPVFKRIYNIYSKADSIQKLDFFSFKRFFSRRKFSNRKNFRIPDKLTQIRLSIVDYTPKDINSTIPFPRDEKSLHKHFTKCTYDPGHFELWFMGWTILSYRKNFPFNPLPIINFLPIIVKDLHTNANVSNDIIIKILPYKESIEIYNYRKFIYHQELVMEKPFLPKKLMEDIGTNALKYEPVDYNLETYNRKMYDAIAIAQFEYNQLAKLKIKEFKKIKNEKKSSEAQESNKTKKNVVNLQKREKHALKGFLN
ncbi:hypothetical protein KBC04_03915 [Candidatus Babeliales bacterium]|nr:hypothetical protein [Candidatus Babeliales bacterium]MBP9844214.1 hypothetical protein [Candidatus Babeliales bacterium]